MNTNIIIIITIIIIANIRSIYLNFAVYQVVQRTHNIFLMITA